MNIRPATATDLLGILDIYNEVIEQSTAIYALATTTLAERRTWFEAREHSGYPVLVATEGDSVLGFSSFGDWRGTWPGYR